MMTALQYINMITASDVSQSIGVDITMSMPMTIMIIIMMMRSVKNQDHHSSRCEPEHWSWGRTGYNCYVEYGH